MGVPGPDSLPGQLNYAFDQFQWNLSNERPDGPWQSVIIMLCKLGMLSLMYFRVYTLAKHGLDKLDWALEMRGGYFNEQCVSWWCQA